MLIPISREIFVLYSIWSFAAGILFGAVYDVFRIRRAAFRMSRPDGHGKGRLRRFLYADLSAVDAAVTFFEDVLFFTFCAVTVILINYKLNFGYPRWYAAAACVGGFALYHITVGRLVMLSEAAILHGIAFLFRFIKKHTLYPLAACLKRLAAEQKIKRAEKFTSRYEKRLLQSIAFDPATHKRA